MIAQSALQPFEFYIMMYDLEASNSESKVWNTKHCGALVIGGVRDYPEKSSSERGDSQWGANTKASKSFQLWWEGGRFAAGS